MGIFFYTVAVAEQLVMKDVEATIHYGFLKAGALSRRHPWRAQGPERALAAQILLRCRGRLVTGEADEVYPVVSCFTPRGSGG
jgi:hypothetical protein